MSISELKLNETPCNIVFRDTEETATAFSIMNQNGGTARLFLMAGRQSGKLLKVPDRVPVEDLQAFLSNPDPGENTVTGFCMTVLHSLERAGILLPDSSDVRMIDLLFEHQERPHRKLGFIQKFDPVIWNMINHHTGSLPLLGERHLEEYAKDPDSDFDYLFDWDYVFYSYFRFFRDKYRGAIHKPSTLADFADSIASATREKDGEFVRIT